jgi:predicted component of type VI protein secretion system
MIFLYFLSSQLNSFGIALVSKSGKTKEDNEELDRIRRAIKRQEDRLKKSETHSRKGKGN